MLRRWQSAPVLGFGTKRPARSQRTLDHTWTKLAYDPYLPCTGQGFLAASGAVNVR
jgi:hypothetical protein